MEPGSFALTYDPTGYGPAEQTYTTTQDVGFFERMGAAFIGIPVGILLIFFPMSMLWWNEHRDVESQVAIEQALKQVVTVPVQALAPANEGRLVHVIGPATASGVTDTAFGLTLPGLVVAQRRLEMYQWQERSAENRTPHWGGGETITTTYRYERVWSGDWLNSRTFHEPRGHENPPLPVASALIAADDAKLGAFRLGGSTLAVLPQTAPISTHSVLAGLNGTADGTAGPVPTAPGFQPVLPEKAPTGFSFDAGGGLYRGKNPAAPAIGDVRLSYAGLPAGKTLTVVARQTGEGFTDFPVTRGYTIHLARVGEHSAETLLDDEANSMATLTWILRLVGVVVMWIGFMLLLGPFAALVSVVPFLGTLAEGLTADIAFVLALILGSITIAVAWLWVHPLISLSVIAATLLVGGTYVYLRRG